ncbi:YheC/YheD family protein [Paenibacillus nanensis]|uniref:YheC/YheD family protein n=1 Tax=Paenibacillus nanensis TaxID=393251 RepID=A0A3A1UMF1_9BACL|nr:YheC/YheD family protein [Paenibacillus nanensis]RIX46340.1 YheC/YheD family protein [Paenibacillus nanensis]
MIKTKAKAAIQVVSAENLPEDTILLGESYVKYWKIPRGQHVQLKFGAFRRNVKVIPVARLNAMRISQALAESMGLPSRLQLRIHYKTAAAVLALGPLIGVLVSRDYPRTPEKPFGSITMFCREVVEACKAQGAFVYFFTPKHIGGNTDIVRSWIYTDDGWKESEMPAPDIVNNRLTTRKLENSEAVQRFLKETKFHHATIAFNEKFLDKSEVFEALKKDAKLTRYLPESYLLRSYSTLRAMCGKHNTVFLKPIRGSLGKGIVRISRLDGESYQAQYATSAGTKKVTYSNMTKLYASVSSKMKSVRYQIQQGLQLIEIGGRPVDFRALVQKNASGKWMITSIVARTAGSQHFVSNLARGGTLSTVSAAVTKSNLSSGISRLETSNKLRSAALQIAKGIDEHIPAHFGELGIDLALDKSGRVWLLEVNSKPSKNDNTPLNEGKIRPSVRLMIQYARFLSGF